MRTVDGMTDTLAAQGPRDPHKALLQRWSKFLTFKDQLCSKKEFHPRTHPPSFFRTSGSPQIPHLLPLHLQTVSAHKTHYNSEYESSAQIPRYGHDSKLLPHYRACLCDSSGSPTKIRASVSLVSSAICRSSSHALSRRRLCRKRS